MKPSAFKAMDVLALLEAHSAVLDELKRREIIRSRNNPTGDYAEWLVSQKLGLTLEKNSSKGYDAKDNQGRRYQIKGRRKAPGNRSTLLGAIRNLDGKDFDFLVAVIFDANWQVECAVKIPHSEVMTMARYREHINGHTMCVRPDIFDNRKVKDLSQVLRGY